MKSNKKIALVLILVLAILGQVYYRNTYVRFEPIMFNLKRESYERVHADSALFRNLEKVLNYYNVAYKVNGRGETLIKRKLDDDKEMRWNYTEKALDTVWLKSHKTK